MFKQETRDPRLLRENPNQPRKTRDPEEFRQLVESVRQHGILQPPGILPDNTIIWGLGRTFAAIEAGLTEIPVNVVPATGDAGQSVVWAMVENLVRSDMTQPETYIGIESVLRLNPSWNQKTLARNIGMKEANVSRYLTVGKNPITRESFLAGKLNLAVGYEIASAAAEAQQGLLNMALSGPITRDQIAKEVRKTRVTGEETVKATSLRIAIGEVVVTVKGTDLTLGLVADLLDKASKEAEKAKSQGLNTKTAEAVWRDRAAKAKAGT